MFTILLVCSFAFGSFSYAKPGVRHVRQAATCGQTSFPNKVSFSADGTPMRRIVGGIEATPHSIPWQVSLRFKAGGHFCGGSLIRVNDQDKSDIVVTAAHCLEIDILPDGPFINSTEDDLDVIFGAHKQSEPSEEQKFAVGKIAKHPGWTYPTKADSSISMDNDIAILKLATPISFSETVQPICLPSSTSDKPADEAFGIISGWGDLYFQHNQGSDELRQVVVPVVNSDTCSQRYGGLDAATSLCVGYNEGGKGSCQGDSGGPLFFKRAQGYVLHGVVSRAVGCATSGFPTVFTRVSNYLDWINGKISELSSVQ